MANISMEDKLRNYIKTTFNGNKDNVSIIIPDNKCLYHISTSNKIKVFTPRVTDRTLSNEDRTIPRICVSENLWDCILGHGAIIKNVLRSVVHDVENVGNKYFIYSLPCKYAVSPNDVLIPYATETNERWIIPFDKSHNEVVPEIIGELLINSITIINSSDSNKNYNISMLLKLKSSLNTDFPITKDITKPIGCYEIIVNNVKDAILWDNNDINIVSIPISDYVKRNSELTLKGKVDQPSSEWYW